MLYASLALFGFSAHPAKILFGANIDNFIVNRVQRCYLCLLERMISHFNPENMKNYHCLRGTSKVRRLSCSLSSCIESNKRRSGVR